MKKLSTVLTCAAALLCCGYTSAISFKSQNLKRIDVKAIQNSGDSKVYLQNNKLTSIDSELCTTVSGIEFLQVSHNQLETLNVSSCFALRRLYGYNNKVTSVKLSKPSSLVEIDLSRNDLIKPPDISAAVRLIYLNLGHNQINSVSDAFDENLALSVLDLSHNLVTHLKDTVFHTNFNLEKLFMDHNLITDLPDNLFVNCFILKIVSLSHNYIKTLEPSLFLKNPQLVHLDISSNKLVKMELAAHLPRLAFLDASKNEMYRVNLPEHLPRLKRADLSHNILLEVDEKLVGETDSFFYLDVSNNNISAVHVPSFDLRKKTIALDGNPLICSGDKLAVTVVLSTDMASRARRMCV